jgi:hypothetical protein
MKLFGIAALGLVAARPQPQMEGLGGGLSEGLGGGLSGGLESGAPVLNNNKEVVPTKPNKPKLPPKKPLLNDKVPSLGDKIKHINKWNEKKDKIHEKYSAAHDKAVAKEDRVEANNEKFEKDHAEKLAHALQKKEEHKAKEAMKKVHAQIKLTEFNTDKVEKEMKHKAHAEKLAAAAAEKKQAHKDKMDAAKDQADSVEKKTELKKQLAAAAQAKKEATLQAKKDKADFVKWAHYHKILFNCVHKLKDMKGEDFDFEALSKADFDESLPGCKDAIKGFDWPNNRGTFVEKWNAKKEAMDAEDMVEEAMA